MQSDIQLSQVIRFLLAEVRRARQLRSGNMEGGLLVTVSAEDGVSFPGKLNCTVAAAGRWCLGIAAEEIKLEVEKRLPSSVALLPPGDPEQLSVFSDTWGPLHFLLSVQVDEGRQAVNSGFLRTEQFLHRLSLVYGLVEIHFILKVNETVSRLVFSGRADSRFVLEGRQIRTKSELYLRCPLSPGPGPQCGRLHPVAGEASPLLLPPEVAETGLCGETSLLPLAALGPCVEQYPNRPASLSEIHTLFSKLTNSTVVPMTVGSLEQLQNRPHILLYGPSGVPLLWDRAEGPAGARGRLAGVLAWEELGISGASRAQRPLTQAGAMCAEVVYTMDSDQSQTTEQTLILFLFVQHSDPFHSRLSDYLASEEVLEQHLDWILLYNQERVRSALQSVLEPTLSTSLKRQKARGKIMSSLPVILSSVSTVVTSSSSLEFRTACLTRMQVRDTHELAIRLHQSLQKVTEDRFLPSRRCDNRKNVPAAQAEGVSGHGEVESRGTGEQGWESAEPSRPSQEELPEEPWGAAGWETQAGKRQCAEELDSNPPPLKQGAMSRALLASESLQQEDALWLQEISNMSDWE